VTEPATINGNVYDFSSIRFRLGGAPIRLFLGVDYERERRALTPGQRHERRIKAKAKAKRAKRKEHRT
jgi:hypothetical protein